MFFPKRDCILHYITSSATKNNRSIERGSFDQLLFGFCLFSVQVWCCVGVPLSWTPSPMDHAMHQKSETTMRLRTRSVFSASCHHTIGNRGFRGFDLKYRNLQCMWRVFTKNHVYSVVLVVPSVNMLRIVTLLCIDRNNACLRCGDFSNMSLYRGCLL